MISKELLSEVLGHKIWKVMDCNMGTLRYCIYPNKGDEPSEYMFPINIHCLSNKCKEWAYLQYGIIIQSYLYNGKWRVDILKGIEIDEFFKNIDSEPEAIFKACQWILDNRN